MQIEVRKPTNEEIGLAESWPTWNKEVSEFPWSYDTQETCLILNGEAEVTNSNSGDRVRFGAGDWVVFPAGLMCFWRITKPIEKKYNFK